MPVVPRSIPTAGPPLIMLLQNKIPTFSIQYQQKINMFGQQIICLHKSAHLKMIFVVFALTGFGQVKIMKEFV